MNTFQKIYKVVSKIPKGETMTYKEVAKKAGTTPRVVGFALHANKDPPYFKCHRVIKSDGTLAKGYAFGGQKKQRELLEKEGISLSSK
ncbi:MAG: MGMT family protein [Patescibacteria group bacterium]|nr:MGMT family protein [Patescibacteria group bacterium]